MSMNNFPRRLVGLGILASVFLVSGCDDSGTQPGGQPPAAGVVSFSGFVSPTFNVYGCTSCHGGSGGLTLTSYQDLMMGGNSGPAIIVGNGSGSLIIRKLQGTAPGGQMPLGGAPLPASKIDSILTWINQGALNN